MDTHNRLNEGDLAPDFSLPSDEGVTISLSDFVGLRVVLYFYPKADTPGCTVEATDFRDLVADLDDVVVVGVSPDSIDKLRSFKASHNLNFPLLSDPSTTVMRQYGAYGEKNNYGKIVEGVIRSTLIIGPDRRIEKAMYNVRAKGHAARVLKELRNE
ncbi:thioredoxin-dependent thiol peroxidase [Corynebacterium sp. ES2794-CONJ1]|uniref:thioredoxin-dependent thiol peroxidase n=1 Tax=unclassified Corynebacterium TaxID=2624378 RepID=UPI00216A6541|nr:MULTISPECIES: thioredoxin-dependent thiol peroxidase [unclassified Corynebacterium]MCS4490669.1 thioredoxin-dependent thiol peroxidase [Corynebacterium sp. ES2775-CONJ]MCS4492471.1 thioredoxin-dependent thiol peroxidase [Corynebacterium sp. ES2715-CONJ3]MCU9519960.1 thioredoxin-dependent thiol peroxidase [Corynebacterium sp. ES2794-CONJ1]